MRILILSCNTGKGHDSCAAAIQQAIEAEGGCQCQRADALSFVPGHFSKLASSVHVFVYRHIPGLFAWGYHFAENHAYLLQAGAVPYRFLSRGSRRLKAYLQSHPADTVVCTHPFASIVLQGAVQHDATRPLVAFVATDYTCSPGVAQPVTDIYFIPHDSLRREFMQKGIKQDALCATGIPVRTQFSVRAARQDAKARAGIPAQCPHLLMMCGSMGCGNMETLLEQLIRKSGADVHITAICGTNQHLLNRLGRKYRDQKRVHLHGYADNISALLDSADVYLTKPGGISTTEAAAKGVPMVFVDAVGGCEAYNLRFFTDMGAAKSADTPEKIADSCLALLHNEALRQKMCLAQQRAVNGNAAREISHTLCCTAAAPDKRQACSV